MNIIILTLIYLPFYMFFSPFTNIHPLYLVYLSIFHHSRMLLVLIVISGDDLNEILFSIRSCTYIILCILVLQLIWIKYCLNQTRENVRRSSAITTKCVLYF